MVPRVPRMPVSRVIHVVVVPSHVVVPAMVMMVC
jgi:hypothetical protein